MQKAMAKIQIPWTSGSGNITLTFTGQGNGTIVVESDDNDLDTERRQTLTVSGGGLSRQVTVIQGAAPNFKTSDGKFIRLSDGKYFNVQIEE